MDGEALARELENEQEAKQNTGTDIRKDLSEIRDGIEFLKDIFVRRLNDDKQKTQLINILDEGARFAFIEPFLTDLILVLDRLEKVEDDFSKSIYEEIYDILSRRGVKRIVVEEEFDPRFCKAVKSRINPEADSVKVIKVIRKGYTFSEKVIRHAEVLIERPEEK